MEIATLFVPIISGIVGYLARHVDLFGQGKSLPAATAQPVQSAHPALTELARLVTQELAQLGSVRNSPTTPTVPSAPH